jgi:hypothetical protein
MENRYVTAVFCISEEDTCQNLNDSCAHLARDLVAMGAQRVELIDVFCELDRIKSKQRQVRDLLMMFAG